MENTNGYECKCDNGCDINPESGVCGRLSTTVARRRTSSVPADISRAEPPTCEVYSQDGCQITAKCTITGCGERDYTCPCVPGFQGLNCEDGAHP